VAEADRAAGYEIESYTQIYPARREPHRALYDPQRNKILS
jgi:hypothetical protein